MICLDTARTAELFELTVPLKVNVAAVLDFKVYKYRVGCGVHVERLEGLVPSDGGMMLQIHLEALSTDGVRSTKNKSTKEAAVDSANTAGIWI